MEEKKQFELKAESDAKASARKEDHIDLAFKSAVGSLQSDGRFYYEPILNAHPGEGNDFKTLFLDKLLSYPVFVSSMTGGTEKANKINHNLAKLCGEFGLGMGLGSCRQLLYDKKRLADFDVRSHMQDQVLMINLGIAQIEELLDNGETDRISELKDLLQADALIVHINPLQEWLQDEGDRLKRPALESIEQLLSQIDYPIVIKEVGQGFGKESLKKLLSLPLAALDLAAWGGTNFSKLELLRSDELKYEAFKDVFALGHDCYEMLDIINEHLEKNPEAINCSHIIFSGGIRNFLDGYYFLQKCKLPSYYAQASAFLKHAQDYSELKKYMQLQIEGLKMAKAFLQIKEENV